MEDIYSSDYSNITYDNRNSTSDGDVSVIKVVTGIIVCIGLPLTLVAIYALYSMVRHGHVAPIYVINLFITDLIQLCCMIVNMVKHMSTSDPFYIIHNYCVLVSVGFMVCIALERYLVIAWPLWYRFRRTIKSSVVVCVVVWALPLVYIPFRWNHNVGPTIFVVFFLLPFPLLIFSLVGALKALSASISVPSDEKRRIVGMLVLVLLIYTLLFLPSTFRFLAGGAGYPITLITLSRIFVRLSPLADLVLYVFMKKGTIDKLLASVCCCRMDSNDIEMGLSAGVHCGDASGAGSSLKTPPLSGQSEQET